MLQFGNKKIEARHGRHYIFSMWEEVRVGR